MIPAQAGIRLKPQELWLEDEDGVIRFFFADREICRVQEDDSVPPEKIASDLAEAGGNLREELIVARMDYMESHLPKFDVHIREFLVSKGWEEERADALYISVERQEKSDRPMALSPDSEDNGWPDMCIQVSNFGDFEFRYPMDPDMPEHSLDKKGFWEALQGRILG